MKREQWVDQFTKRITSNEITFDQVRKILEREGVDEQEIKLIVRLVDFEIQEKLVSKSQVNTFNQFIIFGLIMAMIGFVFTVGSIAGLFTSGDSFLIIIAYGPLTGGLALFFAGLRRRNRKNPVGFSNHQTLQIKKTGRKRFR